MRILARTFAATLFGLAAFAPAGALAADDIHCFSKKAQAAHEASLTIFDVLGIDENELSDEQRLDMLEEYEVNGWSARLIDTPWLAMKHRYKRGASRVGKRLVFRGGNFRWYDAFTMMAIERHADRMSRRTGSRHIYVSPEMRRLARERGIARGLLRRNCYDSVAYID